MSVGELEQARERKAALYRRWKQARGEYLDASDAGERARQKERARILRQMYQEACAEVRRLDPASAAGEAKACLAGRKRPAGARSAIAAGLVWTGLAGDLQGAVDALPAAATGRQAKRLQELVRAAVGRCTPRQMECLDAYYGSRLTLAETAERLGVEASTVSRTLKSARDRVERYVTAKLLLGRCVDRAGRFDYMLFLNSCRLLTERQKEMVYLALARDTSYRDIAAYVGRRPSTVARTTERAADKLAGLSVAVNGDWAAVPVARRDWAGRSEKELAEELGLSGAFYYRVVRRGESVDGVPLLHCAVLHRLALGQGVGDVAGELGCSVQYVKRVAKLYAGSPLPAFREDYRPKAPRRARPPANPFAVLGGGDAILDRIDAETYRALQERFGGM